MALRALLVVAITLASVPEVARADDASAPNPALAPAPAPRDLAHAQARRRQGWALVVPGLTLLAGSAVLWTLSASVDDEVRGGLQTRADYEAAQARGQLENGFAWALGVAGLISVGVGLPLVLTPDPEAPGLAVSGTW